ncbi:MAG: lysine--tRNA ligase [Treponema sp.]|jgi:lysyl-tRNA synthetase class 1|nr:lysine--tRNA ligase [Treponema sp.]
MSNDVVPKNLHWADQAAENIIRERGDLPLYTCASGITPSGTVHIGNFREIISVDLVVRALRDRGKKVRFIYSWDDYDVFRKVPANMPHPEELEKYLRFPITQVPDPFGRDESYARHHEADVETMLPRVGIHPEYLYQAQRYQANRYAEGMKTALQNRQKIKDCLNHYRDDQHKIPDSEEYWPVAAFCAKCSKDTTEIDGYDGDYGVTYHCASCGHTETADIRTAKNLKLGWRVDWPMRWQHEQTLFEPAGKDHHSHGGSFDTARLVSQQIYNWSAPETFRYDFIGIKGSPGKMSSSKGQVINLEDVLNVYQPEITRYLFAGTRPNTEFSISFDLDVLKTYEDYDKTERIAWSAQSAKNDEVYAKERRIYELSQVDGMPESMPYQIPFRHLCNLLQINSGDIGAVIAYLREKGGTANLPQGNLKPEQEDRVRTRSKCAWYWVTECAPEEFKFALRLDGTRAEPLREDSGAELAAIRKIKNEILPVMDTLEEKQLSEAIYAVANGLSLEPKALFTAVYQVLIGKDQGPRLASFMKSIGRARLERILGVY